MLDLYPAGREVRVALRKRPDAVQVIRHQDHRIGREWQADTHAFDCVAQGKPYGVIAQDGTATVGDDREEVGRSGQGAAIVGHRRMVGWRRNWKLRQIKWELNARTAEPSTLRAHILDFLADCLADDLAQRGV